LNLNKKPKRKQFNSVRQPNFKLIVRDILI
jgi:hypothetical protein